MSKKNFILISLFLIFSNCWTSDIRLSRNRLKISKSTDLKAGIKASLEQQKKDKEAKEKREKQYQKDIEAAIETSKLENKFKVQVIELPVKMQEGTDCGYHSIYNGWIVYSNLIVGLTDKKILSEQTLCANKKMIEQWREIILKKYPKRGGKGGGNLIDDEIFFIANNLIGLNSDLFSIIPNIVDGDYAQISNSQVKIIENLRKAKNIAHIFIIGNMKGYQELNHKGTIGHWIAVVFHKDSKGNINYFLMNSLKGFKKANIEALIKSLRELIEFKNLDNIVLSKII